MSVSPRAFAGVIGGLMFLIGAVALFLPLTIDQPWLSGNLSCGSALVSDLGDAKKHDSAGYGVQATSVPECNDARTARLSWAAPVALIGLVAAVGSAVVRTPSKSTEHPSA